APSAVSGGAVPPAEPAAPGGAAVAPSAGPATPSPEPQSPPQPAPVPDEQGGWFHRLLEAITNLPGAFVRAVTRSVADGLSALLAALVRPVFSLVARVVFQTPDLASSDRVIKLWATGLALTDLSLVVLVLARAHSVAWGGILQAVRSK